MASSSNQVVLPIYGFTDPHMNDCSLGNLVDTGDGNNMLVDTCCDSTANNEVEEFIEGFDDSVTNSAQLWIPKVADSNFKPYAGQRFDDIESACNFYAEYGRVAGFDVRRETQRVRNSVVVHKYVVCSKAGNHDTSMSVNSDNNSESSHMSSSAGSAVIRRRKTLTKKCDCNAKIVVKHDGKKHFVIDRFIEAHNHPMASDFGKQFLRANRNMNAVNRMFVIDAAKSNIGSFRAHGLYKSICGSYSDVGATAKDFQNWMGEVKLFIGKRDADMLIEKFKTKQETSDGGFFYEYETDSNGHLTRIFWADVQGRQNYEIFGDVVSFDATYRTNKYGMVFVPFVGVDNHWKSITFASCLLNHEDSTNFTWACEMVLKVFKRPPKCIITDQCPAMKIAIAATFRDDSIHRYCMWHIMQKFPAKIGAVFCAESEFMLKLNKFVWSSHLTVAEFEEGWASVLKEFDLTEHIWLKELYEMRKSWIPAFFRDKPMGGLLRTTSRSESSNFYFNHFVQKGDTLSEFYMCYESALDKQLYESKKLSNDDSCVPQSVTGKEIEKHAARLYTRSMFYKVQREIKASICYIKLGGQPIVIDGVNKYVVNDKSLNNKMFEVDLSFSTNDVSCSCKLFTRVGYLCRHCFFCLGLWGIEEIPSQFLCHRWMKNAVLRFCTLKFANTIQNSEGQKTTDTAKKIWTEFHGCLGDVNNDNDGLEFLLEEMKSVRIKIKNKVKNPRATKEDILQEIYGVRPISSITVHPPLQSNNKGCRKRIVGPAEKSCDGKDRPKRVCKTCNFKGYHDSRNCPSKGKQHEEDILQNVQIQQPPVDHGFQSGNPYVLGVDNSDVHNAHVQTSAPPFQNYENIDSTFNM